MNLTIRWKIFTWVCVQTVIVFAGVSLVLLAFNIHEQGEHPAQAEEERQEGLVVAASMLLLFPLALLSAWYISRGLLNPWKNMAQKAERISMGYLDERIAVSGSRDEMEQLAGAVNAAFDRYQDVLNRLQRFNADASHQLRNPLAAIRTCGEVCLQQPRTNEAYAAVIGDILEHTQRLSRTVEKVLLLARAAQDTLDSQKKRFALQPLVSEVVKEASLIGESRGIHVLKDMPQQAVMLHAVEDLIREALSNLVDNSLKLTPDGGCITVRVSQTDDEKIRLAVEDEGPGVSVEQKGELFRPPGREKNKGRESVGLGLVIVSDICRAHRGCVGVHNSEKGGAVFWMDFPA